MIWWRDEKQQTLADDPNKHNHLDLEQHMCEGV